MVKTAGGPHPLDPLTAAEISEAAGACRSYAAAASVEKLRFNVITLQEPKKLDLLAYEQKLAAGMGSQPPPRIAFCILQTPGMPGVIEVVLELGGASEGDAKQVVSWTQVPGVQALASPDDCLEAEAIAKADPEVVRLLEERYGVTDMANVLCDPWSIHASPVSQRAIQCFMYLRLRPEGNQYAHPIDMTPIVDMDAGRVLRIDLQYKQDSVDWNREENDYHSDLQKEVTKDPPKPLNVIQPEGPSFKVDGNLVCWQKWQFRLGFNYREGVVLHDVRWQEGERLRPVLYRLSLVEMAVPYADPREPFIRKCAFDVGDYGLGYCTFPLTLGCDCLGHIHYFDATLADSQGKPVTVSKAVCMHEEDAGLLYKHVDYRSGHSESRRMRRLVISHIATVVNYEYAFYWYLYMDGTISLDIKLTGELSTNMLSPGEDHPEFGTLVGPGVNAQHHQHMFCARIDPAIDDEDGGKQVVVTEVEVQPLPMDDLTNPCGNAFKVLETELTSVHGAQRNISPEAGRHWKLKNPQVTNTVTKAPVAYKLVPLSHPPLLAQPGSLIAQKGHFATKQLWVTPHDDKQLFPAGDYVFGAKDCTGLKLWTEEEAELAGADPVVWYSFGVTHVVRPEDFPIMPVEVCGFQLKPCGFFTRNPCLDLPRESNASSKECTAASKENGGTSYANGCNGNSCC